MKRKNTYHSRRSRKNRRRITLIFQRDGSSRINRRTVTDSRLALMLGAGVLALLMVIAAGVMVLSEWRVRVRTGQLIAENRLLDHQLGEIKYRLNEVKGTVDSLVSEEELIRIRVNLPPLGEDVRQAGIGSLLPLENQVIGDERVESLLNSLDQIERELSVQNQSFQEIQKTIAANEDRLSHIPAIIPVKNGRFTDPFGWRHDPFSGQKRFHYGVDFAAPTGTPVYATADGKVAKTKRAAGIGKVIKIDHGYGFMTVYGHLHDYKVRRGQQVKRGDVIGYVGNTGRSTGPHLHYEVLVEKRPVNPLDYFYEGYELAGNRR